MKTIFTLLLIISFVIQVKAGDIKASMSYCTFWSPADGPYLETYLSVYAQSMTFTPAEPGKIQARTGITMIFRQESEIKEFKKYELKSPLTPDSSKLDFSYIDQQRILLPDGTYDLELQIADLNSSKEPLKYYGSIRLQYPHDQISFSGIQLVEKYTPTTAPNILSKSGYDLVPFVENFFPRNIGKFSFYTELYHAEKVLGNDEKFLLKWMITSFETGKEITGLVKVKKETAKLVNVLFGEFDIEQLPSGNYNLIVEARNQQNQVIATNSLFFQRSNPDVQFDIQDIAALDIKNSFVASMSSKDTLAEYIRCLSPVSSEIEKVFAEGKLNKTETLLMQQYFLNFWERRDPVNPEKAWLVYKDEVDKVNREYKTPIKKGYETDRGRIYLKYGPPNTISDQSYDASVSGSYLVDTYNDYDKGVVPYQIWHYYRLTNNLTDRKFVFANPNLATFDYVLIHSNVPGEVNNPNWQYELVRQVGIFDKDQLSPHGRFGGKSGDLFNNPR